MEITLDSQLAGRVALGIMIVRGLEVSQTSPAVDEEIARATSEVRARFGSAKSGDIAETADARGLYKSLGIDPTKTRPSSEALLRRVLKGEALYRINTLVDAINVVSLRVQLPFGLYDLAHVSPPVVLRLGAPGERYEGIRKGPVHVEGRPVLVDASGPFGNPTSDSARTMITTTTRESLITVYAPHDWPIARVERVLDTTLDLVPRACGGTLESRKVLR